MRIVTVTMKAKALLLGVLVGCCGLAGTATAAPNAGVLDGLLGPTAHGCITTRVCDYYFGIPVHCRVESVCSTDGVGSN